MTRPLQFALVIFLVSLNAFTQQDQVPVTCPATTQAVLEAAHQLWSAYGNRDASTWDKLVDDNFISTDDAGVRKGKQELLDGLKKPEGHIHNDTDEQPGEMFGWFLRTASRFLISRNTGSTTTKPRGSVLTATQ